MTLPLDGIKIFNATRLLPGGYCATLLSDLGADVIKLEHPVGGDPGRLRPDIFSTITRGNRSITVDLGKDEGKEICYRITKNSHVFMESFRPGVAARQKIDYQTLKGINPKIIYASLSGFGQEGPYRNKPAHDSSYQSLAGMLASQIPEGSAGFDPPSVPIADLSSGMFAAIAILAAIISFKQTGSGQYIDVAMEDGLISWMSSRLQPGQPLAMPHHPATHVYKTKDSKYLSLSIAYEQHFWENLCRAINREDLAMLTIDDWPVKADELYKVLGDTFKSKNLDEWIKILTEADVPHGPVYMTPEEVFNDPQFKHRGMLANYEDENGKKVKQIGSPLKSFGLPVRTGGRPPHLSEHTGEILAEIGYSDKEIEELRQEKVV